MIPRFNVQLTAGAQSDLVALHDYVRGSRSVAEANALLDRLLGAVSTLEQFPDRGAVPRELDALGIREFRQILVAPYRLIYRVVAVTVYVLVIADGRRDMQALLERRLLGS